MNGLHYGFMASFWLLDGEQIIRGVVDTSTINKVTFLGHDEA